MIVADTDPLIEVYDQKVEMSEIRRSRAIGCNSSYDIHAARGHALGLNDHVAEVSLDQALCNDFVATALRGQKNAHSYAMRSSSSPDSQSSPTEESGASIPILSRVTSSSGLTIVPPCAARVTRRISPSRSSRWFKNDGLCVVT